MLSYVQMSASNEQSNHPIVRGFFCLAGFVTLFLGMVLLVAPTQVTNIFLDAPISESGLFFIRFAGTSLLGFSVLNFYACTKSLELLRLAAVVNIASLAPATIIAIWTYQQYSIDKFRWLIVAEHVFFLSGFILCLVRLHLGKMVR